jgi:hypothetical protein
MVRARQEFADASYGRTQLLHRGMPHPKKNPKLQCWLTYVHEQTGFIATDSLLTKGGRSHTGHGREILT